MSLSYLFFVNSSSLLPRWMLYCMSSLAKSHVQTGLLLNSLEHVPQSYWEAVSWAVSSVAQPCPQQSPRIKLKLPALMSCVFLSADNTSWRKCIVCVVWVFLITFAWFCLTCWLVCYVSINWWSNLEVWSVLDLIL